jgi:hypothetical protein
MTYENELRLEPAKKQTQSNPISKAKKMLLHLTPAAKKIEMCNFSWFVLAGWGRGCI